MNLHADPTRITIQDCVIPNAGLVTVVLGLFAGNRAMALEEMTVRFAQSRMLTDVARDTYLLVKRERKRTELSVTQNAVQASTPLDAAYVLPTVRQE